jgi:flavorubredoxin
MSNIKLAEGVYCVGAIDWDRRLFDSLIPLPDGTSYNSYVIKGSEKTALIDTVDPTMQDVLINQLNRLGIENISYIVANHAEQDHSGALPRVLERYPEAKVVATPRCKDMLIDLLMIPEEKFIAVNDKETISLGDRTLEFIHAPWVHWPETMLTYLREDKILFPCDFFGTHLATSDLYVTDEGQVYEAAKRYYAEIMMPFRTTIQKNLEKIRDYAIDIIAPSHGPVHDKPEFILKAYHSWVFDEPKNIVVLPYISMHGSTHKMVEYLVEALVQRGVTVKLSKL